MAEFLLVRFVLPAQPVDATPSNQLIRQYFPWRTDLFGCTRSKPRQGSVPADLTWRAILAFVFNARWVRAECCVDPLRPPDLSGLSVLIGINFDSDKGKAAWTGCSLFVACLRCLCSLGPISSQPKKSSTSTSLTFVCERNFGTLHHHRQSAKRARVLVVGPTVLASEMVAPTNAIRTRLEFIC